MGYTTERRKTLQLERQREALEKLKARGQHLLHNTKGFSTRYPTPCWCGYYHRILMKPTQGAGCGTVELVEEVSPKALNPVHATAEPEQNCLNNLSP